MYADCDGRAVELVESEDVVGNPELAVHFSRTERAGTIHWSSENEDIPFRPLHVEANGIVFEYPLTEVEFQADPAKRRFLALRVGSVDAFSEIKYRVIEVVGNKVTLSPVQSLEESPLQHCRLKNSAEKDKKPEVKAPLKNYGFTLFGNRVDQVLSQNEIGRKSLSLLQEALKRHRTVLMNDPEQWRVALEANEKKRASRTKLLRDLQTQLTTLETDLRQKTAAEQKAKALVTSLMNRGEHAKNVVGRNNRELRNLEKDLAAQMEELLKIVADREKGDADYWADMKMIETYWFQSQPKAKALERFYARLTARLEKNKENVDTIKAKWDLARREHGDWLEEMRKISLELTQTSKTHKARHEEYVDALVRHGNANREAEIARGALEVLNQEEVSFRKGWERAIAELRNKLSPAQRDHSLVPLLLPLHSKEKKAIEWIDTLAEGGHVSNNLMRLSIRNSQTFKEVAYAIIGVNLASNPPSFVVSGASPEYPLEALMDLPVFAGSKDEQGFTLRTYLRDVPGAYSMVAGLKRESKAFKDSNAYRELRSYWAGLGFDPNALDGLNIQLNFVPALARRVEDGTLAFFIANKDAYQMVGGGDALSDSLRHRIVDEELGSTKVFSLYSLDTMDKYYPDVLIHEVAHALDKEVYHWSSAASSGWDRERNLDAAFPQILERERRTLNYREKKREFLAGLKEGALDQSPLSAEEKEKRVTEAFEDSYFGKGKKQFREDLEKMWKYQHSGAEKIAFSLQISFLRDVKKMDLTQVINHLKRLAGKNPQGRLSQAMEIYFSDLYFRRFPEVIVEVEKGRR